MVLGEILAGLLECYENNLRKDPENASEILKEALVYISDLLKNITVLEINKDVLKESDKIIRDNDSDNRDRIIISTAISHKCKSFYTSDTKFIDRVKEKITKEIINIRQF